MLKNFTSDDEQVDITAVRKAFDAKIEDIGGKIDKLSTEDIQAAFRKDFVDKMYMKSLENAYIESLEKLVSSPHNFDNLIKPNNSKPLSDLAAEINELRGRKEIDYSNPGNMMSRTFMSGLRQAFVSGKYAIGIAAVGQTGHAQRQRTLTYIDVDNMDNVPEDDKQPLGNDPESVLYAKDTNINFQEYNSMDVNGINRPVISMINSKSTDPDTKLISDVNGMFIDGYVDISKGPWIMELGATPNVASTWLFLIDLGVPIKTIAYFMNQPIIVDYLETIQNKGYNWLFIEDILQDTLDKYKPTKEQLVTKIPSESSLRKTVPSNAATMHKANNDELLSQQQYMLKEFIKYAKMASHMFLVTQGSNFDTANLNDPRLIFKKKQQYEKGKNTIISSIDNIVNNSFIGDLKEIMYDVDNSMSTILLSGKENVKEVMEPVLMPFVEKDDRTFTKISQKADMDLFDWAMQNYGRGESQIPYNEVIAQTLLQDENEMSVAKEIIEFRNEVLRDPDHPLNGNIVIRSLQLEAGISETKPDNLTLTAKDGKSYNQDIVIAGFNEIKENVKGDPRNIYRKLVRLALIQSGLTNSPISFAQLLPYKDFKEIYNAPLSLLEDLPNLEDFRKLDVLQRNNWSNSDIVTPLKATLIFKKDGSGMTNINESKVAGSLRQAIYDGQIPKVMEVRTGGALDRQDFVLYSVEDAISKEKKAEARKKGDYSYIKKYLMKKVYYSDENGDLKPLTIEFLDSKGVVQKKYLFKAMNAWGDSFRAQEFYDTARPSVLDNGIEKVLNEVDDEVIVKILGRLPKVTPKETFASLQAKQEVTATSSTSGTNSPNGKPGINQTGKCE